MDAYKEYLEFITLLRTTMPVGLYNDLVIRDNFKNKRISSRGWLYNRHHICEIDVTGCGIMKGNKANSLSIIVDVIQHCLLHYLIVLSGRTSPNWGMSLQFDDGVEGWDAKIKEGCKIYDIEYIKDWKECIR